MSPTFTAGGGVGIQCFLLRTSSVKVGAFRVQGPPGLEVSKMKKDHSCPWCAHEDLKQQATAATETENLQHTACMVIKPQVKIVGQCVNRTLSIKLAQKPYIIASFGPKSPNI